MSTTTSNLGLYEPTPNTETGWGALVNNNWVVIDGTVSSVKNSVVAVNSSIASVNSTVVSINSTVVSINSTVVSINSTVVSLANATANPIGNFSISNITWSVITNLTVSNLSGISYNPSGTYVATLTIGSVSITTASITNLTVNSLSLPVWSDYFSSSSVSGWTTPAGSIFIKRISNTVFVNYVINGTSNSVLSNFTVPYAGTGTQLFWSYSVDGGGTPVPAYGQIGASSMVILYPTASGGNWNTNGTKTAIGQFWYEAAS